MKYCVLIAGMPASGKTSFADYLAKELSLPLFSKDRIKEILYDTIGFCERAEKVAIGKSAMEIMYYAAENLMLAAQPFILENNFENLSKPGLLHLLEMYAYKPVVVRFGGDVKTIYKRYLERESSPARHRGHIAKKAYPETPGKPHFVPPMSFEEFVAGMEARGIRDFTLGDKEIYIDTTDFSLVHYHDITARIREAIAQPPLWPG